MIEHVQIDLASSQSTACEHFEEIREAVENAAPGLEKYGVTVLDVQKIQKNVIVRLRIPDELRDFRIGNHFRGVSAYLLRNYKEEFQKLIVSKRLLAYTIVPPPMVHAAPPACDRFSAVSRLCALLEHAAENEEKVRKIMEILFEEEP